MEGKKKFLYTILMLICIAVFIFALYNVINILLEYKEIEDFYDNTIDEYVELDDEGVITYVDLPKLIEKNSDVKGWMYIEGTAINYPVLQGPDNDYYLYVNYDDKYSEAGSIFVDSYCNGDMSDDHTIIYGHNMKNDTMFGTLNDFKNQAHRDAHPYVYILTPNGMWNKYEIFAYYRANINDGTFDLFTGNVNKMKSYVDLVSTKNYLSNDLIPTNGEKVITLSTCTEDLADDSRNVLQAKLVGVVDKIQ